MDGSLSTEFKKTNQWGVGKKKHHHIAFLTTSTDPSTGMMSGTGFLSEEKDHKHKILYVAERPEQANEYGQIIQEARPAGWYILPAESLTGKETDGHVHNELNEYVNDFQPANSEEDKEVLEELLVLWKEAVEIEKDSKEKADESDDFYKGKQWDQVSKDYLNSRGRAALTLNEVEKNIDTFMGLYQENKTEISYAPQEGSDQRACDLYNHLSKIILTNTYYDREKTKAVRSQVIRGRGLLNTFISLEDDLQGEIKVEAYQDSNFYPGPHEKEDLSDCEYLFKEKNFSLGRLKILYPNKAKDLDRMYQQYSTIAPLNTTELDKKKDHIQYNTDQYAMSDNFKYLSMPLVVGNQIMVDVARKNFKVLECQRIYWMPSSVIVSNDGYINFNASGWYPEDLSKIKSMKGTDGQDLFYIITRNIKRLRITRVAGNTVLADEFPADLPSNDYYIVPLYNKKMGDDYWGKVESVKDAQREINKRHSQVVDIGNRMTSYGWIYDDMTFDDPNLEERFKQDATTPGFMAKVSNINNKPVKEEGVKFPTELVQLMDLESRKVTELMNITVEPGGANESAAHLMQRTRDKLVGNEHIFSGIKDAEQKIGRLLIGLIQRYYDGERILRMLVGKKDPQTQQAIMMGEQPIEDFTAEEIDEILSVSDADKFDVVVIQTDPSPTAMMLEYSLLEQLQQRGMQVPPQMLIDAANIPQVRKDKLNEFANQASASEQQSTQQLADVEIEKTLASKGIITPGVQERLGIDAMGRSTQGQQDPNAQIPQGQEPAIMPDNVQGIPEQNADSTFSRPKTKKVYKNFDPTIGKEVLMIEEM